MPLLQKIMIVFGSLLIIGGGRSRGCAAGAEERDGRCEGGQSPRGIAAQRPPADPRLVDAVT